MDIEMIKRGGRCPIGGQGAHAMNLTDTECLWCGPSKLCRDADYMALYRDAVRMGVLR